MIIYPLTADEPIVIEFAAPDRPLTMNDRLHWRAYARTASRWRSAAYTATLAHDIVVSVVPRDIRVELPVIGKRRRDPHNWYPTVKHIVDGIVATGRIVPDDAAEWITTHEPTLVPCTRAEHALAPVRIHITPRSST